jgi:hypothetical protein
MADRWRAAPVAHPWLRAVVAIGAMAVGGVLVARAAAVTAEASRLVVLVGVFALLLQAAAVLRWPLAAGPAGALLGLLAVVALLPATNRGLAVEMVVEVVAAVELTGWASRLRGVLSETPASIVHLAGGIGAAVALSGAITGLVLAASRVGGPTGRAALVLGIAAAVVPLAVLAVRRRPIGS